MIDTTGDPDVSEETPLVEQLDETPVGAELARLLASVDRSQLSCAELLRLAAARQRQIAHDEAQMLTDLHAITRTAPRDDDEDAPEEPGQEYAWASAEAAMALRWTPGRAVGQMLLAEEVIDRLPQLHTALDTGRIDIPKVLVITKLLAAVDTPLATALVDKIIDKAEQWTTAELRQRLRRLLMAADPDTAAKKARAGIKHRRVQAYTDDDTHLAYLGGYDLAPHRVAAVMERLDAVAAAAKASGDERTTDQIRADVFMDFLTGEGIAAGGLITDGALGLADPDAPGTADPHHAYTDTAAAQAAQTPWPTNPPPEEADTNPADTDLADADLVEDLPQPQPPPADPPPRFRPWLPAEDDGLDPAEAADPTPAQRAAWLAAFDTLPTTRPATWCALCGHTTGTPTNPGPMPGPRRGVIELVATTDTLMGLADLPAEINPMGPVVADIARQVTTQINDAEWRYSIYDPMTRLLHHGTTNTRPAKVEHQTRRRPTPKQAAWIKARDRRCIAPGCRRRAQRCDIDHTHDWVKGGETIHCNLCLLCRHHHLFKHATGSELIQPTPGVFWWRTPAGLQYHTRSDPPLLLDPNQLAGIPKPANPDTTLLPANHSIQQWQQPSSLGPDPHLLSPDDLLTPQDIQDPDHLPIPQRVAPISAPAPV